MKNTESMIEKLEASAAGEKAIGNHEAASTFTAKAARLRRKFNLPAPAPVKETPQDKAAEFMKWLESIPLEAEVVVDDPIGGMQRTMPLEVVLARLKSGELLLIKMGRGFEKYAWKGSFKYYSFFVQEVAPPKEKNSIWI
jgi:hypothetical protein